MGNRPPNRLPARTHLTESWSASRRLMKVGVNHVRALAMERLTAVRARGSGLARPGTPGRAGGARGCAHSPQPRAQSGLSDGSGELGEDVGRGAPIRLGLE